MCEAFAEACYKGHLEVAKWLLTLEGMDPCARECQAFVFACAHDHLDAAKWLLTLEGMDPCAQTCRAFVVACMHGHLGVAKWLLALPGTDPCAQNCRAFRYACILGHLGTTKWLLSLPDVCGGLKRLNVGDSDAVFHKKTINLRNKVIRESIIDKRRSHFATAKLFIREVTAVPEEVCLKVLWAAYGDGDIEIIGVSERAFNDILIK
jgi:hypothetical protein